MGAYQRRSVNSTLSGKLKLRKNFKVESGHRRFPGQSIKLKSKATLILFRSGKFCLMGCKSKKHITEALTEVKMDYGLVTDYEVKNVVVCGKLGEPVDLPYIRDVIPSCDYEPELFSGLVTKINTGATCIIFTTGSIIVTGCKSFEKGYESLNIIIDLLQNELWGRMLQSLVSEDTH